MKKIILIILIATTIQNVYAQKAEEWKTQTLVTGYFALNGEFINNLPVFKEVKGKDYGINIAEASVLTTIKPLEKLKINSVITYKPRLEWDEVITELSGEWHFNDQFIVKAGRFLLPLHPANAQYYAPMNVGVALPIFVTNHSLFPLNINGVNLAGDIPLSNNLGICYNFSGGQYTKLSRTEEGILGFFGRDGVYMNPTAQQVKVMIANIDKINSNGSFPQYMGGGGKVCLKIGTVVKFGFAGFYGDEESSVQLDPTDPATVVKTKIDLFNYGLNFTLDNNNLQFKASAWFGSETPEDTQNFDTYNIELYYGEIAYTFNKYTPYSKVELVNGRLKDWTRATFGLNYRPLFETMFKIEYHRYFQEYVDNFDVFQISAVYSF